MSDVVFRRIHGRIVPIKKKSGTATALSVGAMSANVLAGIVSGLSLIGSKKRIFFGQTASLGLDIVSSLANVASKQEVQGRGNQVKAIAKGELLNNAAGWAAFGATTLLHKPTRKHVLTGASKSLVKAGAFLRRYAR